jgi:hypothetical protein
MQPPVPVQPVCSLQYQGIVSVLLLRRSSIATCAHCRIQSEAGATCMLAQPASAYGCRRRCLADDQRGVGETLSETQCGCHGCNCMGLIARGKHYIFIGPPSTSTAAFRRLQVELNDPLISTFAAIPTPSPAPSTTVAISKSSPAGMPVVNSMAAVDTGAGARGAAAAMASTSGRGVQGVFSLVGAAALPENVHLVTLMRLEGNRLLVRLAHQFQVCCCSFSMLVVNTAAC